MVASWESLCDTYRALEFSDPLSDSVKLEEYKWIIREMNKFLSRMRGKLRTCKDADAMRDFLQSSMTPTGKVNIDGRRSLAYQKLRQRWIVRMLMILDEMMQTIATTMEGDSYVQDEW